jgi:hypothetical protein
MVRRNLKPKKRLRQSSLSSKSKLVRSLPNDVWDHVKRYLSPYHTGTLLHSIGVPSGDKQHHEKLWCAIFKDEAWLDYVVENGGHPGLLLLGQQSSKRVILLLHQHRDIPLQELRNRFFKSVHSHLEIDKERCEFKVGKMELNLTALFHKNLWVRELSAMRDCLGSYCFWTDARRKLLNLDQGSFNTYRGSMIAMKLPFEDSNNMPKLAHFVILPDDGSDWKAERRANF